MDEPTVTVHHLDKHDAARFRALRLEAFRTQPRAFRYSEHDEARPDPALGAQRLEHDYAMGAFDGPNLIGIGGLATQQGTGCSTGPSYGACM